MEQTQSLGKQILFWGGIIVGIGAVVAGMIYLVSLQQTADQSVPDITIENVITPEDWSKGNKYSKVKVIEYADFQCPACGFYYTYINKLSEDFPNDLAVVYRHFPLPMHPYAKTMAYAAEAAGKQGKFWEMHDLIFQNQDEWSVKNVSEVNDIVTNFAKSLGLNLEQFNQDMISTEIRSKVDGADSIASNLGLSYTPSIFINGKLIKNPASYDELKGLVAQTLNEKP